ncbi:MAG: alpha glucosidase [Rhodospirillales bacterium]|nr:alpha glucosidase [Rhodospirillales bacterium]MCB9995139.1 alpha glucosidase [Rhodospirillales bacterium]
MSNEWWRGGIFYQIYPRSFFDSNGDGIGDLYGITTKLEHIASLGVDAIWISPFYKSPMIDFGYDVSDYRDVDPIFGVNEDFDALLRKAHNLGLKIIVDMVLSHTSDKHPWFVESRTGNTNAKADWYIWADPKPDGTPPNNWQSIFGGPSWTFDTRRGQYYMHNFFKEQPDLNYHNPAVQDAILEECRFWFERGVDGFRLDTANFYFHDKELRDNPPKTDGIAGATQLDFIEPYAMQRHVYDKTRPENIEFIKRLRALSNEYEGTMLLGEIGDDNGTEISALYSSGDDKLHTTYSFSLMHGRRTELTASLIRSAIEDHLAQQGNCWPSWAFSNHDVVRSASRFNTKNTTPDLAKLILAILCSLRGTAFIYQGEELGLPEAEIPFERLQDPWGKYLWPEWQGRDGCRTPMPWHSDKKHAGFSAAKETWLPVPDEHQGLAADLQEHYGDSTLNFTRALLKWRKNYPALKSGDIAFHDFGDNALLGFSRTTESEKIFCLFNLSDAEKTVSLPVKMKKNITLQGKQTGPIDHEQITLPAFGFCHISFTD